MALFGLPSSGEVVRWIFDPWAGCTSVSSQMNRFWCLINDR